MIKVLDQVVTSKKLTKIDQNSISFKLPKGQTFE